MELIDRDHANALIFDKRGADLATSGTLAPGSYTLDADLYVDANPSDPSDGAIDLLFTVGP